MVYGLIETYYVKMKKFTTSSIFFNVFLIIALVFQTHASKIDYRSNKYKALFIFGDSFLDAGNNNYINTTSLDQANFLPYGETYFKFPTGRFSDGRLISDFIGKMCIFYILVYTYKIQFS
jgi:hypothetical protein